MASQTTTMSSVAVGRCTVPFRATPSPRTTGRRTAVCAAAKREQTDGVSGVQKFARAGAHFAMSLAAATLVSAGGALAELPQQQGPQGLPPQLDENQDLGPNEVTKKSIGDISLDADNPYDTATPGRAGQVFGEKEPGQGDVGAVDEAKVKDNALRGSGIVDKIKSVLPFQALPMFDLALDQDTADLGPNEVSKKTIEDTSVSANNPFDKATPGRSGQIFGGQQPGQGDVGAVDKSKVEEKAQQASSIVDKVKSALPFQTLPVLDLAVAPDDKNLGPNEVDKSTLAKLPGANNKFDTATPGRAGEGSDNMSNPKGAPSIKAATDAIKGALSN